MFLGQTQTKGLLVAFGAGRALGVGSDSSCSWQQLGQEVYSSPLFRWDSACVHGAEDAAMEPGRGKDILG